jgi:hypothetical protein
MDPKSKYSIRFYLISSYIDSYCSSVIVANDSFLNYSSTSHWVILDYDFTY